MDEMKFAFISHSNKEPDLSVLLRLDEYLVSQNLCAWFDVHDLRGDKWRRQISEKIKNASVFVLISSERSLTSPEVKDELSKILNELLHNNADNKKVIIPLLLDDSYFTLTRSDNDLYSVFGANDYQAVIMSKFETEQAAFERLGSYLKDYLDVFENNPKDFVTNESETKLIRYVGSDSLIRIPAKIREIGEFAFAGQSQLHRVAIHSAVEKIERAAFVNCENLTTVEGMQGITSCDVTAFDGTGVVIDDSNGFSVNGVVFGGQAVDGVLTIPEGTKTIANGAFRCCGAHTVVFPEGLENIGAIAFKDCSHIKQLVFPKSLKTLGKRAFEGCRSLTEVTFLGEIPADVELAIDKNILKEIA